MRGPANLSLCHLSLSLCHSDPRLLGSRTAVSWAWQILAWQCSLCCSLASTGSRVQLKARLGGRPSVRSLWLESPCLLVELTEPCALLPVCRAQRAGAVGGVLLLSTSNQW